MGSTNASYAPRAASERLASVGSQSLSRTSRMRERIGSNSLAMPGSLARGSGPALDRLDLEAERADVVVGRADDAVVAVLLHHVRAPPGDARDGEDRREQVHRDPHRVVRAGREEVDVGVLVL